MLIMETTRREARHAGGEWLRKQREARDHMSQAALGERIGKSDASVSGYERGVSSPDDATCELIAAAFGISVLECRRGLGLYNPPDAVEVVPTLPPTFEALVQNDPTLAPRAKEHLINQYQILRLIPKSAFTDAEHHDEMKRQALGKIAERKPRSVPKDTPKRRRDDLT